MNPPLLFALEDIFRIFLVVLGIGAVIFVHELGHFLVAKWSGVRVEAFSLGFPPTLVGIRRRPGRFEIRFPYLGGKGRPDGLAVDVPLSGGAESPTEYRISLLPLGGYVKMAGEAIGEGEGAPDELKSQGVAKRGAIFGAGVAMNAVFAIVVFAIAFSLGVPLPPALVGDIFPETPAASSELRIGDRIVSVNGNAVQDFNDLVSAVAFSTAGEGLVMEVERGGERRTLAPIVPAWDKGRGVYSIGVAPMGSARIAEVGGPAAAAEMRAGDTIAAVNGRPVANLPTILAVVRDGVPTAAGAIEFEVVRGGQRLPKSVPLAALKSWKIGIIPEVVPRVEELPADSPLAAAGLRVGDLVLRVGEKALHGSDKTTLEGALEAVRGAATAPVETRRAGAEGGKVALSLPTDPAAWAAIRTRTVCHVNQSVAGSAATAAGIAAGDQILRIGGKEFADFPAMQGLIQESAGKPLAVETLPASGGPARSIEVAPRSDLGSLSDLELTGALGLRVMEPVREIVVYPPGKAIAVGFTRSFEFAKQIVQMLVKLVKREVATKNLGGPVTIVQQTWEFAGKGAGALLWFLAMLSVNLAILNLLPIPILDGGHLFFLGIEAVKGKPVSEGKQIVAQYVGLLMLLVIMLAVTYNDLFRR
ncbi:MAG: RIP metalloprotease RseP [Planctomycetales bacterium]|nr:RIP metalloprotease RseP [Planctomycetales bacterium]